MLRTTSDDRTSENEIGTITAVLDVTTTTTTTSGKPVGLRQLSLCVRFIICLKKTRTPLLVRRPSRSSSSRSYVAVEVESEGEEDESESKKQRLVRIVRGKDLKALEEFGGVDEAVSFLSSESRGFENGGLELSVRGTGFWDSFFLLSKELWYSVWQSFNSWTIFFLIIAADLCFAIGLSQQGSEYGWHDGVGILVAVLLLVFVPSVANFYRKRKREKKLLKNNNNLNVCVERGGILQQVSVADVMVGEIVHLKEGDRLPADGLLIRGNNLILDEVLNPKVDRDQNPFLFSGSVVRDGDGVMIAVSSGADTALGKGLVGVTVNPSEETLLQDRILKPYDFFDKLGLTVSVMVPLLVLIRLLCGKHDDYYNDKPEIKGKITMTLIMNMFERIFLKSGGRVSTLATVLVAIIIGIQHGMPCVISVSLCFWGKRIGSLGGKSQNLSACGTTGLITAICVDITGELSFNKVDIGELWIGKEKINREMDAESDEAILEILEPATRGLFFDPKTSVCLKNDLVNLWANSRWKMNMISHPHKFDIIGHKQLSSKKGVGALMRKNGDETDLHLHYNGDATTILNMCSQYYDISGRIHDIENQKHFFKEVIKDMVSKGLRPIAFACKQTHHQEFEEDGMKLLGFVGLKYSCQEIMKVVEDLKCVGVRIVLTSEDELSVARAMAYDLGIFQRGSNDGEVVGEEIRKIMKAGVEQRTQKMESVTVMGKANPEDKLLLVEGLKGVGHVVAFFGGLTTSDAPALREADVGVTQENWSTEISQTVSDLVVVGVESLTPILRCGRCAYLNIQKFYRLQMTASISGLLITLVSTVSSGRSPITTFHLFWVTLIMCILGGLMMVTEWNYEEVKYPLEGDRNQSLITKVILKKVVIHVLYQALVFLLFEYLGQKIPLPGMNKDVWSTMIFNTFILCQIFNLLDTTELVKNGQAFEAVRNMYWFPISLVVVSVMQVMVIEFFGTIVNCVKLSALQWAICVFFASLTLTLEWALNILSLILTTLASQFDSIESHCRFIFFASLMFVISVSCGFQLS